MDVNEYKNKLIEFAQEAVRTRSYSDEEGNFAALIKKTMEELKYDEVLIDSVGNVVGKIGNGSKIIHFDSQMDTVRVYDVQVYVGISDILYPVEPDGYVRICLYFRGEGHFIGNGFSGDGVYDRRFQGLGVSGVGLSERPRGLGYAALISADN